MKEWYLMTDNTRPNITSGFENEAFRNYKDDTLMESLDSDIADTVLLYNYDLSTHIKIKGIISGNLADTQLKSMERSIIVPIGTLHSGDYIFFEDEFWIVDGRPGNNKVYEKATLKECQYKLRWQKDDGTIVERWANLTSASKYDVGETGNNTIFLTSNNLTIIIPHDKDSLTIDGKRVFIDSSEIPEKVFKITRNDDVLFTHGLHGGTLNLIADKTELNLAVDRQDLRICDYISTENVNTTLPSIIQNKTGISKASISFSGKPVLKIGGSSKSLSGIFLNDNVETSDIGVWEIITIDELYPYVKYEAKDNVLNIKVLENEFVNSKIRIKFSNFSNEISTYVDFQVISMI